MKRNILLIGLILTILTIIILIFFLNFQTSLTGQVIASDYHSRTRAICNETHCQDYEILCNGTKIVSKTPITDLIEKPEDWTDPRNKTNNLCE